MQRHGSLRHTVWNPVILCSPHISDCFKKFQVLRPIKWFLSSQSRYLSGSCWLFQCISYFFPLAYYSPATLLAFWPSNLPHPCLNWALSPSISSAYNAVSLDFKKYSSFLFFMYELKCSDIYIYTQTHTHIKCVLYICINTYSQTVVFTLCLFRALGLCETQEQNPCADWFPSQEQFLVIDSLKKASLLYIA